MAILSDLGSSLTGNIESAYITIHDYRKLESGINAATDKFNAASAAAKGASAAEFKDQIAATAAKISAQKELKTAMAGLSDVANDMKKRFRVQFNPSELQLYASALEVPKTDLQKKQGSQTKTAINMSVVAPNIEMTVNLFFDHMNIYDSFMADKVQLSALGVQNIITAVRSAKGAEWTVQPEVEGFIAALRSQYTQKVTFNWETFAFEGSLSHISAQYTMFSVSGKPVRAKVTMRLKQLMDKDKLKGWFDDFEAAFGDRSSSLVRGEQYAGNLLNFAF